MQASTFSIPTDNFYKFACLFGLALIVSGVLVFITSYNSALEKKITYSFALIELKHKATQTKADTERIEAYQHLIQVVEDNEDTAAMVIGILLVTGICCSAYGGFRWRDLVQKHDDEMAALQRKKLQTEIDIARAEAAILMRQV